MANCLVAFWHSNLVDGGMKQIVLIPSVGHAESIPLFRFDLPYEFWIPTEGVEAKFGAFSIVLWDAVDHGTDRVDDLCAAESEAQVEIKS